jgi:glucokinase
LAGIGIGAPNGNYYNGTIEFAPKLEWKGIIPVVQLMKKHFPSVSVVLTNDANAAAIGEMIYGYAKEEKDFIMITLGTGVGSGIVSGGRLIYGHDGFAGEIGHTIYDPNGRLCGCGRKGCLETYASASGIVKTAVELLKKTDTPSELRKFKTEEITAKMIGEAANLGDEIAIETFEITTRILGLKLADSVAHTSPSSIYIFGGVAKAGNELMKPLKRHFENSLLEIYRNKIKIRLSGLPENDAAILGAAALIQQ